MAAYLCHEAPDLLTYEAAVLESHPGAVALDRSAFYPGGGGQPADQGILAWQGGAVAVTGLEQKGGKLWHLLAEPVKVHGIVEARIDPDFRFLMQQLHTGLHIVNALAFKEFDGALVTGANMSADGTARIDLDLPGADNQRLRDLEVVMNDVIDQDLPVRTFAMPLAEAAREPGTLRSKAVTPPPQTDGSVRIVEITGLDRQACGGTHLTSTGESRHLRILKVENKGRHNRRIKIGLAEL
ncbi:alanyl-tRNA editing protein [Pelagibius litoralis]|uniref:Alanine--tRNA ligase n=1 Tax=Pelagibius litoralis TaxID=374515 RepID=A0A967EXI2_9PROT|nr:alanyl-tRNA editing protein [Pelagibius litoralis]NIA69229.1 alanyl-tRNA editing protein [Pelagibius litoralis]